MTVLPYRLVGRFDIINCGEACAYVAGQSTNATKCSEETKSIATENRTRDCSTSARKNRSQKLCEQRHALCALCVGQEGKVCTTKF